MPILAACHDITISGIARCDRAVLGPVDRQSELQDGLHGDLDRVYQSIVGTTVGALQELEFALGDVAQINIEGRQLVYRLVLLASSYSYGDGRKLTGLVLRCGASSSSEACRQMVAILLSPSQK